MPQQPGTLAVGCVSDRVIWPARPPRLIDVVQAGVEEIEPGQVDVAIELGDLEDGREPGRRDAPTQQLELREEAVQRRHVDRARPEAAALLVDPPEVDAGVVAVPRMPRRVHDLRVRALAHAEPHAGPDQFVGRLLDRMPVEAVVHVGALAGAGRQLEIVDPDDDVMRVDEPQRIQRAARPAPDDGDTLMLKALGNLGGRQPVHGTPVRTRRSFQPASSRPRASPACAAVWPA